MGAETASEEQFGPYVVYERLGVGGMATVHRALELGAAGFERVVALKRLLPHLAEDASFIKSFVREAKLASLLSHVNIVQIYELGRVGTQYFITMEYIDGRDVRQLLRHARRVTGPPPLNVTIGLVLQLCEALDYAHNKVDEQGHPLGLVHRDVSPSNLLVTSNGHLKVIDFGIAKAAQSSQLRTHTGRVKGKLAYMAPEAVSGSRDADARSDIWAVGVICHELLTARPLFATKNEYQTLDKVQRGDIVPPSAFNQACPPELDAIVAKALERNPDRRFSHAATFRDELMRVRQQFSLQTRFRDIASWVGWAFSVEPASFSGGSTTGVGSASPVLSGRSRTPLPARNRDEEEAVELVWGSGVGGASDGPVVLDDVPDVSERIVRANELDDAADDLPTPVPGHGRPPVATTLGDPRVPPAAIDPVLGPGTDPPRSRAARLSAPPPTRRPPTLPPLMPLASPVPRTASPSSPPPISSTAGTPTRASRNSIPPPTDSTGSAAFLADIDDEMAEAHTAVLADIGDDLFNALEVALTPVPDPPPTDTPVTDTPVPDAPVPDASVPEAPLPDVPAQPERRSTKRATAPPATRTSTGRVPAVVLPTAEIARVRPPDPVEPEPEELTPAPRVAPAVAKRPTTPPAPVSSPVAAAKRPTTPPAPAEVAPARAAKRPTKPPTTAAMTAASTTAPVRSEAAAAPLASAPIGAGLVARHRRRAPWVVPTILGVALAAGAAAIVLSRDKTERPSPAPSTPRASPTSSLQLICEPADCEAHVDGQQPHAGTPWSLELPPGVHQIEVHHSGYKPYQTSVDLTADEKRTVQVLFQPLSDSDSTHKASLAITTTPPGIEIILDNLALADRTPIKVDVAPGAHTVVLRQNGAELWHHEFVAAPDSVNEFHPAIAGARPIPTLPPGLFPPHTQEALASAQQPSHTGSSSAPVHPTTAVGMPPGSASPAELPGSASEPGSAGSGEPPVVAAPAIDAAPSALPAPPTEPVPPVAPPPPRVEVPKVAQPPSAAQAPLVVGPGAVTKVSGDAPQIASRDAPDLPKLVAAKLCIDTRGRVTSAEVLTKIDRRPANDIVAALRGWIYAPFRKASVITPVCFPVALRMK